MKVVKRAGKAEVSDRVKTLFSLDEKADQRAALKERIEELDGEKKAIETAIKELIPVIGVRQSSGTLVAVSDRYEFQLQNRESASPDADKVRVVLGSRMPLLSRAIKQVTVEQVDEQEIVAMMQEGKITQDEVRAMMNVRSSQALVIKPRKDNT